MAIVFLVCLAYVGEHAIAGWGMVLSIFLSLVMAVRIFRN